MLSFELLFVEIVVEQVQLFSIDGFLIHEASFSQVCLFVWIGVIGSEILVFGLLSSFAFFVSQWI